MNKFFINLVLAFLYKRECTSDLTINVRFYIFVGFKVVTYLSIPFTP